MRKIKTFFGLALLLAAFVLAPAQKLPNYSVGTFYLNGVTLTSQAVGFTIAGGTAGRTFTLTANSTVDQDLATTASPVHAGLTLTAFSGYVKATAGVLSAGSIIGTDISAIASNAALAADGVLATTLADTSYGHVYVKETTAKGEIYTYTGTTLVPLTANAAYTVTKDNALTVNVYFEGNVLKVQNKTALAINVKVNFVGII